MNYERLISYPIESGLAFVLDEQIGKRVALDVTLALHRTPNGSHIMQIYIPHEDERIERNRKELCV